VLGHTADEVLNRTCHEVIGGCDRNGRSVCGTDCPIHRCVARGELPPSVEIQARTRDGPRVWLHLSVIVIPHEPGPLKAHILHDVTDHRHATEFMAQVASMLHETTTPACDPAQASASGGGEDTAGPVPGALTLTARERAVLRLMAEGLSNRVIAGRLQVSACTVRNHVQHILTKFGAHTRAHAVSLALRGGLFR
jgi:DNA-binding CsgD family transcriptional regulator